MARLRWSPIAISDLEEICALIASDPREYARLFAKKIINGMETVADFLLSGRIIPKIKE